MAELVVCDDVIKEAAQLLASGSILAVKGLGGFHLACDARNEQAVNTLRKRKGRPDKPLAVMMRNLDEVRKECFCDEEEATLLLSPHAPIVLLRWREESRIARNVAPGNRLPRGHASPTRLCITFFLPISRDRSL